MRKKTAVPAAGRGVTARRVGTVAAIAAAAALAAAGTANANVFNVHTTDSGDTGGHAVYTGSDEIGVCDDQADGLRAWAQFSWDAGTRSYMSPVEDARGAGTCNWYDTQSLPKGRKIWLEVCLRDGPTGALRYCATKTGTAGS